MRILVVRTDKLGDFITAIPTFFVLKNHHKNNTLIACVSPLNKILAEACPFIDEVIVDDGGSLLAFSNTLRRAKIDASITLFSNTRVAIAQFLAGIKIRIAPATKIAQLFYNQRVKQRRSRVEMAEFEYNLALTRRLYTQIDLTLPIPLCSFDERETKNVYKEFCLKYNITKPVIAFHPGFGGSSDANLTLIEYIDLVKIVVAEGKYQAVMTFGPGEEQLYEQGVILCKGLPVVCYNSNEGIVHFTKLLASFKLFVSTSTGTYHLAGLVNTPTMTFFGDSLFASVKRWKTVSEEKNQHPFMLPVDEIERSAVLLEIKNELKRLVI